MRKIWLFGAVTIVITILTINIQAQDKSKRDEYLHLALAKYQWLIENNPDETRQDKMDKIDAYYHLGLCQGYLGDAAGAESTFQVLWNYYNAQDQEIRESSEAKQMIADAGSRIAMSIADNMDTQTLKDKAIGIVNQIDGIFPQYSDCRNDEEKYRRIRIAHALGYILYKSIERFNSPPEEAITQFRKIIDGYSNPPVRTNEFVTECYYFAGHAAILLDASHFPNKWNLARTFLEGYVQRAPNGRYYQEAKYYIAYSYYMEGNYNEAAQRFEALIHEFPPGDVRWHYYLGKCYANMDRNLDALSKFDTVLNMDLNHKVSPAALIDMMVLIDKEKSNLSEAVERLTWLKNRHSTWVLPLWENRQHPRIQPPSNLDRMLSILDEEMVTLYPENENAPLAYFNLGVYYSQVGGNYDNVYSNQYNNNPNPNDFNDAIQNYWKAYEFYKGAYNHSIRTYQGRSKEQIIPLITNAVMLSLFEVYRLIQREVDYERARFVFDNAISKLRDMRTLIPQSVKDVRTRISGNAPIQVIINSLPDDWKLTLSGVLN